jgi:hypothetical protein
MIQIPLTIQVINEIGMTIWVNATELFSIFRDYI